MSNELLWFIFALVNFAGIMLSYKFFGKFGLLAWVAMGTVVANIQVMKFVELFGFTATLGNIMFGTLFLATDTLNEKYGLKEAKRAVLIGFFTLFAMVIIMQMALWFEPAGADTAHGALESLFGIGFGDVNLMRVAAASLVAYLISQLLDVHLFQKIRKRFSSAKTLYIRNLGSTMISQLIDSLIFAPIAFIGVVSGGELFDIIFTTYVIKLMVAALDTPFIYLMKWVKPIYN